MMKISDVINSKIEDIQDVKNTSVIVNNGIINKGNNNINKIRGKKDNDYK